MTLWAIWMLILCLVCLQNTWKRQSISLRRTTTPQAWTEQSLSVSLSNCLNSAPRGASTTSQGASRKVPDARPLRNLACPPKQESDEETDLVVGTLNPNCWSTAKTVLEQEAAGSFGSKLAILAIQETRLKQEKAAEAAKKWAGKAGWQMQAALANSTGPAPQQASAGTAVLVVSGGDGVKPDAGGGPRGGAHGDVCRAPLGLARAVPAVRGAPPPHCEPPPPAPGSSAA